MLMFFPATTSSPAAVALPDWRELATAADVIVVGELLQRDDADGMHQGVILVREVLAGDVAAGDDLAVAWARRPVIDNPALRHVAGYTFAPRLEGEWIFILAPRADKDAPFQLDHGRQIARDNLEDAKAVVAKGLDRDYIGKTEAEAAKLAEERGLVTRVVSRDGEAMIVTEDHRVDRVNLDVNDGVVTAVKRG